MTEFCRTEIPWRDPSPQIAEADGGACDPCGDPCDDITVGRGQHTDVNLCCLCAGHDPCDACEQRTGHLDSTNDIYVPDFMQEEI